MKTLRLISIVFLWSVANVIFSQTGSIEGIVKDSKSGEALFGATILIDATTTGTTAGIDGRFVLQNLKAGTYKLKISYISYLPESIEKVKVEPGKTARVDVMLKEDVVNLAGVTVTAVRRTNTEISMISDIKTASFVSSGISGQQISKTLDKDASEVVKRVPGITIQDGRFIIVRGLAERYNNVWLNNAATPSSEADVRAFSFDVIPSTMIENIMIIKSPSAELPADFSGGFVKIATKNMPDKNSVVFSYGTGFTEGSTFRKFYKYNGSKTDILGFDDGMRALPEGMPAHLSEYETATNPVVREKISLIGRAMNKTWVPEEMSAMPDQKLLLGINRKLRSGTVEAGNTTALSWSLSDDIDFLKVTDYTIYDFINDKPLYLNQFDDQRYTNSARVALMHNWAFMLNPKNKIEFRNLFNQAGYTRTTRRSGREWYNDGRYITSEEMRYLSRSIYTGQLAGDHSLNDAGTVKIDWIAGYSYSSKNEPDTKRYRYIRSQQDPETYLLLFGDQADLSSVSRMWIKLYESTMTGSVNLLFKPVIMGTNPEIRTGFYYEDKARSFNARNFGYAKGSLSSSFGQTSLPVEKIFTDENINLDDGIRLTEMTSLSDSYTASNLQMAGYASVRLPITAKLILYSGIRLERNRQTLSSYKQGSTVKVDVNRDTVNIFPSANLTYNFSPRSLIRGAYGLSINRPEFREIAPFYYVDFEMNAGIYGAPEIRQAYIHNFDLKYEYYPADGEMFSFGVFYKNFINPIEQVILGNSPTQYSFSNVKSAYSTGFETEMRKSLSFIPRLKNLNVVVNASVINSKVHFNEGSLYRNRPMEGQSPFIVNAGLFYQNDKGLMMSLLYNVIGKRIVAVGRPSPNQWEDIPDIYEMPRNVIDFTFSKAIGRHFEIKAGVKDILNQPVRLVQNVNTWVDMSKYAQGVDTGMRYFDRDQVNKSYYPGRSVVAGISLKF